VTVDGLLDGILAIALVVLAWRAMTGDDLVRCVVLFIVFGLVLALSWVRLDAPDIALAEAAIGAGLTGALLLDTVAQLLRRDDDGPGAAAGAGSREETDGSA
jgi:uncharacterized MnhB-related membrane protein